MIELRIALQPKQSQFLETVEKTPITFYGGAKGGGKSGGLRRIILARRIQYPGTVAAIFRKSYPELESNHIEKYFTEYPVLRQYYTKDNKTIALPNGSMIKFRYAENIADLGNYQGNEFHDLAIDEAGEWEEQMFWTLLGSNRSSIPGVEPRCMLTGNPGGIGHGWLKRLFIERRFREDEDPNDFAFIQALVQDNAALVENDPNYVKRLKANPNEALKKAYLYGDWDIFAGQFFGELNRDVHLIEPFEIPDHWTRFGSYDWGYNHCAAFGWFAVDEDGNVYLYREYVKAKKRVDEHKAHIKKFPDSKLLYPILGGHDCFHVKKAKINKDEATPKTIAEEMATFDENDPKDYPIVIKPATISRIPGASQVRSYLACKTPEGEPKEPRFYIFKTCPITFDCLSRMIIDPDNPEDVLKVDAIEGDPLTGDDPYDMARMGLMSRPAISEPVKPKIPLGSPAWYEKQNEEIWERERERLEQEQNQGGWPSMDGFGTM